jgi:hypothetical protein
LFFEKPRNSAGSVGLRRFTFSGWVARSPGWLVTEIGRQPWLVPGILYTEMRSAASAGGECGASLTAYVLTYTVLLISYVVVLTHIAGKAVRMSGLAAGGVHHPHGPGDPRLRGARPGYDLGGGDAAAGGRARRSRTAWWPRSVRSGTRTRPGWSLAWGGALLVCRSRSRTAKCSAPLYIPVMAMLVGLMLRGVAFELRIKAEGWHRELWNWLFWGRLDARRVRAGPDARRYITGSSKARRFWLFAL